MSQSPGADSPEASSPESPEVIDEIDADEQLLEMSAKEAEFRFPFRTRMLLALVAFLTGVVPSVLFQSVVDLHFEGVTLLVFFAVVIGLSTLFLTQGYYAQYRKKWRTTRIDYRVRTEHLDSFAKEKAKFVEWGSLGSTLWVMNAVYIGAVLLLAFHFLKESDPRLRYLASLVGSAFFTRFLFSRPPRDKSKTKTRKQR